MTSIPKDPLPTESDPELEALKDSAATQRALDYYLNPAVSSHAPEDKVFAARNGLSHEEAIVHASDLLRCAIATAHESAVGLQGAPRDLAFSVVYIIEMAKLLVDKAIDTQKIPAH